MIRKIPTPVWIVLLAAFILLTGGGIDYYQNQKNKHFVSTDFLPVQDFINLKIEKGQKILAELNTDSLQSIEDLQAPLLARLQRRGWSFLLLDAGKPIIWTSTEIEYDSFLMHTPSPLIYTTHNKSYLYLKQEKSNEKIAFLVYKLQEEIRGKTQRFFEVPGGNAADINTRESEFPIVHEGQKIGYLHLAEKVNGNPWTIYLILFAFGLLVLSLGFYDWVAVSAGMKWGTVLFLFLFRWLLYERFVGGYVDQLEIFDPAIYASSFLLPSLGDLVLHLLFLAAVIFLIFQPNAKPVLWKTPIDIMVVLIAAAAGFAADLFISINKGLVMDSSISYDPGNIISINSYSIIAALIAGFSMLLLFKFVVGLLQNHGAEGLPRKRVYMLIVPGVLFFVVFQMIDAQRSFISLLFPLSVALFFLAAGYERLFKVGTSGVLLLTTVCAMLAASVIFEYNRLHEQEFLRFHASKLVSEKDIEAEYEFARIEKTLVSEFLVPEDFTMFATRRDPFEKRLRRLYFKGYLDKFELQIFSFDSLGQNVNGACLCDYDYLSNLYDFNSVPTISNHFYHIKDPTVINGYIARFDNCDIHGHNGTTFLLLRPKFIQFPHLFPQILKNGNPQNGYDISHYSYGVYVNGELLHQRGDFPYPLAFRKDYFRTDKINDWFEDYRHFIQKENDIVTVILSRPFNYIVQAFSMFTFLFVLYLTALLVWLLLVLLVRLPSFFNSKYSHKIYPDKTHHSLSFLLFSQLKTGQFGLLSSKIRLALLGVLIAGLLVSVYLTTRYVQVNYETRLRTSLIGHLLEGANQLQNEADLSIKISHPESRQLLVNQLADLKKTVVHIYDKDGVLLASSEPQLFEEKVQGRLMDPEAFKELSVKRVSQFQQQEVLTGLHFHAAYAPLTDENRKTIAYLNMPYFDEQEEISYEVSSFLMAYINLYFLLFIVALALAWFISTRISRPLIMIKEKISRMALGNKNETIEWRQKDEIGDLVRQYNKMVMELEESAHKLSESEREGAWREMARQVAHEIKNPLTPLKLNVQHLQRAWHDKSDKLEDTFQRVTKIMIEQIESLSNLASSFSNFAKMPKERFEKSDIVDVLNTTIHLFEKSSEIKISTVFPSMPIYVFTDKEQMGRVFNNLIKNAIQAIPEEREGSVEIKVSVKKDVVLIEVADNGNGIDVEIKEKIFTPNFSTKTSGMGLGLAIARKTIETSGGKIYFKTRKEKGTIFIIELPLFRNEGHI